MVCGVCGTRNIVDEKYCSRCGARLPAPQPVSAVEQETEPLSPSEALAAESRQLLTEGNLRGALQAAQRAAVVDPDCYAARMALGEAYLALEALNEALREFRRAAELDPDRPEAKERAEIVRRQMTGADRKVPPASTNWREWLVARKAMVSVIAGVVTMLLVFSVGAWGIISRTSPEALQNREYAAWMRLGSEYYRGGRYAEAARAFEEAARVKPDSRDARHRLDDARAMAGLPEMATRPVPVLDGQQVAAILPSEGPNPFPQVWVGPQPRGPKPGSQATDASEPLPPPPPLPAPEPKADTNPPPLPPPTSTNNDVVDRITGPPRAVDTSAIEPSMPPPGSETPLEPPTAEPTEQRKTGHIMMRRIEAPPASRSPDSSDNTPKVSSAEVLRAEAERLRASGRHAEAATKFGAAAAEFRSEASQGGPTATIKRSAAESCERAQKLCESQAD